MKTILTALRLFAVLTLITGVLYPLAVTGIAKVAFPSQTAGSVLSYDGKAIGSSLLAQKTESPRYFWPRPSAADYATVASGASNMGPTSAALADAVKARREKFGANAPADLLTASGSGLDPHISPEAAYQQAQRISTARKLSIEQVHELIRQQTEAPQFGFWGEPRVNVLLLNLALDTVASRP